MWTLSIRPSQGSGFAPVDVTVRARPSATVHDLAVALGGRIEVTSEPGGGTAFALHLPAPNA